jgi:DNA-directed RNA polymerase subunit RPC12/RpoP
MIAENELVDFSPYSLISYFREVFGESIGRIHLQRDYERGNELYIFKMGLSGLHEGLEEKIEHLRSRTEIPIDSIKISSSNPDIRVRVGLGWNFGYVPVPTEHMIEISIRFPTRETVPFRINQDLDTSYTKMYNNEYQAFIEPPERNIVEFKYDAEKDLISISCPECAGSLESKPTRDGVKCPYCGFIVIRSINI